LAPQAKACPPPELFSWRRRWFSRMQNISMSEVNHGTLLTYSASTCCHVTVALAVFEGGGVGEWWSRHVIPHFEIVHYDIWGIIAVPSVYHFSARLVWLLMTHFLCIYDRTFRCKYYFRFILNMTFLVYGYITK